MKNFKSLFEQKSIQIEQDINIHWIHTLIMKKQQRDCFVVA